MGELGSDQAEQLDRNMWAPEDQEDSAEVCIMVLLPSVASL